MQFPHKEHTPHGLLFSCDFPLRYQTCLLYKTHCPKNIFLLTLTEALCLLHPNSGCCWFTCLNDTNSCGSPFETLLHSLYLLPCWHTVGLGISLSLCSQMCSCLIVEMVGGFKMYPK